ncbi:MAG TPA: hypothetical protein VI670_16495, partial [Thermoanaerobaculia bacterium]
ARDIVPFVLFCAIWFGAIALMVSENVPIFIPGFFALLGFLIVVAMIDSAIGRTIIRADTKGLVVRRRWLGPVGFTQKFAPEEVDSIVAAPTANSPFYQLDVVRRAGSKLTIAQYVRSRKDAEMLAARLERDMRA